jgi:hypothetical protein
LHWRKVIVLYDLTFWIIFDKPKERSQRWKWIESKFKDKFRKFHKLQDKKFFEKKKISLQAHASNIFFVSSDKPSLKVKQNFDNLEIVSLKPQFVAKNNEANTFSNRRYKSVNHRTIPKYAEDNLADSKEGEYYDFWEYSNHLDQQFIQHTSFHEKKRYNISQAARAELMPFELPDLSRRSERKRIKISTSLCKNLCMKLPQCFSITDKDMLSPLRDKKRQKLKPRTNLEKTGKFREVHSEQVSPRNLDKTHFKFDVLVRNSKFNMVLKPITRKEWDDPNRFAPICGIPGGKG